MQLYFPILLLLISYSEVTCQENGTIGNSVDQEGDGSRPIVTIEDGDIRGRRAKTFGKGTTYYAFLGIPYAQPPINDLRFRPPVKIQKWQKTLSTTEEKHYCIQGTNPVLGSEDCLYINVYTPSPSRTNMTVMVWIYGGGFMDGDSTYNQYAPDFLLDEDIIYVAFNYRIGAFGFLSTEDLACPGNIGLKDQVMALQWVQDNIKHFGGNPQLVTIFGESAGSASVSYHLQSHMSKGLFRSAIMESGSSLCLWALNRRARATAYAIGKQLNVNTTTSTAMMEGLRKLNWQSVHEAAISISVRETIKGPLAGIMFGPVIEPIHEGSFFHNYSAHLLSEGDFHHVPVIIGMNSNEGAAAGIVPAILRLVLTRFDIDVAQLAPADLTTNVAVRISAGLQVKLHYFGLASLAVQPDNVIQFVSDDQFNRPIRKIVQYVMKYAPVYYYKFSHKGQLGGLKNGTLKGVGHTEEMGYIFRRNYSQPLLPNDGLIRSRMVKLWTNFAKYSNPTPKVDPLFKNVIWPTANNANSNGLAYLDIQVDMQLKSNPFNENMMFYDNLYKTYGSPPYNTY